MKLKLIKFNSVESTNDEAIRIIRSKKNYQGIVTSNFQTKGRGTMGKKWISQNGNLFISIYFAINEKKFNFKQFAIMEKSPFKPLKPFQIFGGIVINE